MKICHFSKIYRNETKLRSRQIKENRNFQGINQLTWKTKAQKTETWGIKFNSKYLN